MRETKTFHEGHAAECIREEYGRGKDNKYRLSIRAIEEALLLDKRCPTQDECRELVADDCSRHLKMTFAHVSELIESGGRRLR